MADSGWELTPIHDIEDDDLVEKVAHALNAQWKRSLAARLHSLKSSTATFPMTLVLLDNSQSPKAVVGTAKISRALEDSSYALIESVLIVPSHRGKGAGRIIMSLCETRLATQGFSRIMLSTTDQEGFYRKLGYIDGHPVSPLSTLTSRLKIKGLTTSAPIPPCTATVPSSTSSHVAAIQSGPPPPPPPPQPAVEQNHVEQHIWLMKAIQTRD